MFDIKESWEYMDLIKLSATKECEYLDFKRDMYDILSNEPKRKLRERKEFLKDVLALVNNKRCEKKVGVAYLLIGMGESEQKFNGEFYNVDFNNYQTLTQLVDNYITPPISIKIHEYFCLQKNDKVIIEITHKEGYSHVFAILLYYIIGTVYEIKKEIGNSDLGISAYVIGLSFIRDGYNTRLITEEDRKIIRLLNDINKTLSHEKNKFTPCTNRRRRD